LSSDIVDHQLTQERKQILIENNPVKWSTTSGQGEGQYPPAPEKQSNEHSD
jgi:hypothetical protein